MANYAVEWFAEKNISDKILFYGDGKQVVINPETSVF